MLVKKRKWRNFKNIFSLVVKSHRTKKKVFKEFLRIYLQHFYCQFFEDSKINHR